MSLTVEALAAAIEEAGNWNLPHELAERLLPFIDLHIAAGQQEDALVLRALVAAGHVDQSKVDQAREITNPFATLSLHGTAGRSVSLKPAGTVSFDDLLAELSPEKRAAIDRRYQELLAAMEPKPAGAVPLPEARATITLTQGGEWMEIAADEQHAEMWAYGTAEGYDQDQLRAYGDAREAAGRAGAVPEGYAIVPRVPTLAMENAWDQHYGNTFKGRYSSMLSAAPIPQQPAAEGAAVNRQMTTDGAGMEAVGYKVTHVESSRAVGYYYLEIKTDDPPKIGSTLYASPTPAADAGGVKDVYAELIAATKALRSFDYRRGDLIHQNYLAERCKCAKCIEERADAALAALTPEVRHGE